MTSTIPVTAQATLADELQALYQETKAKVGDEDLAHIRNVTAYAAAIDKRRRELLNDGGPNATGRAIVLESLYRLLQFSELGHNIIHGSYDHLPNSGQFHSDRYDWDFNVDTADWKVMHHEGHHPNTNIVDTDHDLGYSVLRAQAGQDWFGHHVLQLGLLGAALPVYTQLAPFMITNLARKHDGRRFFSAQTLRAPARIAYRDTVRRLVSEPIAARQRFLPALFANHVGGIAGYLSVLFLVAIEHHAGDVEVFPNPGPDETPTEYYVRQIRGTRNFERSRELDSMLEQILIEEVPFRNRPDFEIFYGGLDTHIEHHIFPDLPPNRQREIAPLVKEIAVRHGLPYYETPLRDAAMMLLKSVTGLSLPFGERELRRPLRLLAQPLALARRLAFGATYRSMPEGPYLDKPRFYNVPVKVRSAKTAAGGQALHVRLQKPHGWNGVTWSAGAYLSLRVEIDGEVLVRQYSLVHDSDGSDEMEIAVKRVAGGRVSNHLNDTLRTGQYVTVVGKPTSTGGLTMTKLPRKSLFIAGGVGITPIISHLRIIAREHPQADAVLLYFNRDKRSVLFEREIRALARESGIRVHFFTGTRISSDLLRTHVRDAWARETYVCAPPPLIDAASTHLAELGQEPRRFHTESFTAPTLDRPADDGRRFTVSFRRSDVSVEIDGATTLLEAAGQAGIRVPTGCLRGLCRACVTPKLSGTTQHEHGDDVLDRVTVCDSLAYSDVELDI